MSKSRNPQIPESTNCGARIEMNAANAALIFNFESVSFRGIDNTLNSSILAAFIYISSGEPVSRVPSMTAPAVMSPGTAAPQEAVKNTAPSGIVPDMLLPDIRNAERKTRILFR
jgi:hypothetical protein